MSSNLQSGVDNRKNELNTNSDQWKAGSGTNQMNTESNKGSIGGTSGGQQNLGVGQQQSGSNTGNKCLGKDCKDSNCNGQNCRK